MAFSMILSRYECKDSSIFKEIQGVFWDFPQFPGSSKSEKIDAAWISTLG